MGTLAGKVAVVTGGGSGIGLATATRLAGAGRLGGRGRPRRRLGRAGRPASSTAWPSRPTSGGPDEWPGIVDAVTRRFGGIDLAHLNAGVTTGEADITKVTDEIYARATGVNVDGVFYGVRAVVPAMAARGGGAIVATASLAGLIGFSPDPVYCLTKHAVVGLVRSLGPQLADRGITINAVCPSIVDTPLIADMRGVLESSGFPLIDVGSVSTAVVDLLAGEATGEAMVIQAGREALAFRFARPPGPRAGGTVGQMPPKEFAAHDQA